MIDLSSNAWDNRYKTNDIGWDLGEVSPPLKAYSDQLENKALKILIPGGGNSYEAEYLFNKGFINVFVVDLSKKALSNFKERVPKFPEKQLLNANFFDIEEQFDLVIEQTFFCAIHPSLRKRYVEKINTILRKKGKIVGVLFNVPLNNDKPPFGGSKEEYIKLFSPFFDILKIELCYNSFGNRKGREFFIKMLKNKAFNF